MQRGDIVLGYFPFGDVAGMKLRPLLLITAPVGAGREIVAAYISSVLPNSLLMSDIRLDPAQSDYQSTRLKVVSILRLHKIATIHTTNVQRHIGHLSNPAQQAVDAKMRTLLML